MADRSRFFFAACHPGAEVAVIAELAISRPAWRPAFRRPGFVTFKMPAALPIFGEPWLDASVFAHRYGPSLGKVGRSEAAKHACELPWPSAPRFSVWMRPTSADDDAIARAHAQAAEATHALGGATSSEWVCDICL